MLSTFQAINIKTLRWKKIKLYKIMDYKFGEERK
jgi:hypothetical protein